MKGNIRLLFMSIGIMAMTSACTDLDVDVKSQYTSYPDSEIALEAKLADVYYAFRGPLGRNYNEAQTFASDEATGVSFGGDYWDEGRYAHPTLHDFKADDACIGYWSDLASGITKCNTAIIDLGGEDDVMSARPRAMRAFYHFILMDSFGDVPILDHVLEEDEAIERSPRADVARFIEKELLAILDRLPINVDESTYGKPTKWMAEALLVKLYINWAVYTCGNVADYTPDMVNEKLNECVKYCDDIIQNGPFDLSDSYRKKFYPDNGPQIKDFIYAMPYDPVTATGMTYGRFRTWRKGDTDGNGGATYYGYSLPKSVGGNYAMTPEFADLFSLEGDERNEAVLMGQIYMHDPVTYEATNTPYTYKGKPVVLTKTITLLDEDDPTLNVGADVEGWSQGYRSIKWYIKAEDYANDRNQDNDVPIFRYADILLTKAEAILRGADVTNGDTPESLMNQIRTYVHAPLLTQNPTLDELLDERGREFFDENWRRNDLIRFGKFEDDWGFKNKIFPQAKTEKFRRVFPVPTNVLNENTNWSQTEGY